jgi:hypothetical protein
MSAGQVVKYVVIGGIAVGVGYLAYTIYDYFKHLNTGQLSWDFVTSNPITEYLNAQEVKATFTNPLSPTYDPAYANAKIVYTDTLYTASQLASLYPNYSGPIVDITPTQAAGYFINVSSPTGTAAGSAGNPYLFSAGWKGQGYYSQIPTLSQNLVYYIPSEQVYNDTKANPRYIITYYGG